MSGSTNWPQPPHSPATEETLANIKQTVEAIADAVIPPPTPPLPSAKAIAALTYTGTALTDGDTVTIGTQTYTFKTLLTGAPNEVLIGAVTASLTNLKAAVNAAAGSGDIYGSGTVANEDAVATILTGTLVLGFEAAVAGEAGNSIAKSETSSNLTWDVGATLSGGTD